MTRVIGTALCMLLAMAAAGCAIREIRPPAGHPASPSAPTGRLADPMPALRPGVIDYTGVPALRQTEPADTGHHHHH